MSYIQKKSKEICLDLWQADSDLKTQWVMTVLLTDEGTAEPLGKKKQLQINSSLQTKETKH